MKIADKDLLKLAPMAFRLLDGAITMALSDGYKVLTAPALPDDLTEASDEQLHWYIQYYQGRIGEPCQQ